MFSLLRAFRANDPAAKSNLEVILLYPGFRAILIHRVSHFLFQRKVPFIPRLLSEISRWMNGMDIHPGAKIGKDVVIDHGLGIVIGETAVVGDSVILYQIAAKSPLL